MGTPIEAIGLLDVFVTVIDGLPLDALRPRAHDGIQVNKGRPQGIAGLSVEMACVPRWVRTVQCGPPSGRGSQFF